MTQTPAPTRQLRSSFALAIAARANYESSILDSMSGDTERAAALMADALQAAYECGIQAFVESAAMPTTLNESASLARCWSNGYGAASERPRLAA